MSKRVGRPDLRDIEPAAVAAWIVPVALVLYLALMNGGYGSGARSVAGVVAWLTVAVASLVSARPFADNSWRAMIPLLLLAALAAWTGMSLLWSENDERTAIELGRVLAYLGVFALATAIQGLGYARQMLAGLTFALTAVCALALASRIQPTWFPERVSGQFIPVPEIERRLAYPLNYSGGIATTVSIVLPLLLLYAWSAKRQALRVLAAMTLPMVLVTLWLTGSGMTLAVAWIGPLAFIALAPDRLPKLATAAAGLVGGGLLAFAVVRLEALDRGLPTPEAIDQGHQLLLFTLVVMASVGLIHWGIERLASRRTGPRRRLGAPSRKLLLGGGLALVATVIALIATGALDSQFDRFQSLENVPANASRLSQVTDIASSGRYQQWSAAIDAGESAPVAGIGAGTFEFWWARNGLYGGFVRDGHSLYFETWAELGLIGLALVIAVIAAIAVAAVRLALRESGRARTARAGAIGGLAAFAAAAGVDWMWELGVLAVAFFLLAGAALSRSPLVAGEPEPPGLDTDIPLRPAPVRIAPVLLAPIAIVLIALPALADRSLEASRAQFDAGDFQAAYESAKDAEKYQPFAATPRLQQALILEQTEQIPEALEAAQAAVERGATDWRNWLVLSDLQEAAGDAAAAQTYEKARSLNPRSTLFAP